MVFVALKKLLVVVIINVDLPKSMKAAGVVIRLEDHVGVLWVPIFVEIVARGHFHLERYCLIGVADVGLMEI
jgi:hypothetical protein